MKKISIIFICTIISIFVNAQNSYNEINQILNEYIKSTDSENSGIIIGVIDFKTNQIFIDFQGEISKTNDLRLVCPASKPAISYMILKENININSTIDKWFPEERGYEKSNKITLKMLLSNTSGIPDYVGLIDSSVSCTPQYTIDVGYKNRKLIFEPRDSVLYSNTGFNMAGVILEKESSKSVNMLIDKYFKNIAPSIRMDDGKGNYPKGYPNLWPYHYSQSGFAGGLIGTIEDYLKMMSYIVQQAEYKIMTDWVIESNGTKWGLGFFGQNDIVMYHGNSGVNYSMLLIINSKIVYLHTTNELNYDKFQNLLNKTIPILIN